MTWIQYTYFVLGASLLGLEIFAVVNDRPGDTITATIEQSFVLWVPMVVLCAWTLAHFTLGLTAQRTAAVIAVVLAVPVWLWKRPDRRNRR